MGLKKAVFILIIILFLLSSAKGVENYWDTKASMHFSRTGATAAVINEIIYVMGGSQKYNTSDIGFSYMSINSTEAYQPSTDTWIIKSPMPTPRDNLGAAVFQGKIYCFGGRNVTKDYSISINANEMYDPKTDSWEIKTPMPTARSSLHANEVNKRIYLIGGRIETESTTKTEISNQVEIYDPISDTWANGSPIPKAVAGYASAVLDNKIYIISGVARDYSYTNLTQIYDPKTDEWSVGAPIPMSVTAAVASATNGSKVVKAIYVIGGGNATYPLNGQNINQVYFPDKNLWTTAASMPVNRAGSAIAVVNDALYVIGGGHNIFTRDSTFVMQYNPLITTPDEMDHFSTIPAVITILIIGIVAGLVLFIYFIKRNKS